MSKAFTREDDASTEVDPEDGEEENPLPKGTKNYMTPGGFKRLKDELHDILHVKRPQLTATIAWAASNGDRSENADYIYGKRRLREIDRRIRFLTKRIESAEVIDPATRQSDQVFFGATVTVADEEGVEKTYTIVGIDEIELSKNRISWISPLARALLKAHEGDSVTFQSPKGQRELDIVKVEYIAIPPSEEGSGKTVELPQFGK